MIDKLWSRRLCHVKTAYGVSAESYRSTLTELLFGIWQDSTAATDIFGILYGLVMYVSALVFIGIIFLSMSDTLRHERMKAALMTQVLAQKTRILQPSHHQPKRN
jgi:hypothetical protein